MKIKFIKMTGLGNDYIYILNPKKSFDAPSFAKKFCRRGFSIGGDGVVTLKKSPVADIKMAIFNSDGSEAEICGNAIRCVAKLVYEKTLKSDVSIQSKNRLVHARILSNNLHSSMVEANMGEAKLVDTLGFEWQNKNYDVAFVDVSNPHAVVLTQDFDFDMQGFANKISKSTKNGVNVEFVKIIDSNKCDVVVFERGSGRTLACGSGACAVGLVLSKIYQTKSWKVCLEGGQLVIDASDNKNIKMTGPAELVFKGEVELD